MNIENAVFLSGVELSDGTLMMATQDGTVDVIDTPHTIVRRRTPDGDWSNLGQLSWTSACVSQNPAGDGIFLVGPYGRWIEARADGRQKGDIIPDVDETDPPTVFRNLKPISGRMVACGTDRYIYAKLDDAWSEVSDDTLTGHPEAGSAECIAGFSAKELYAFGWDGELWSNQSGQWEQQQTPTNVIFNDACTFQDEVYVGGQLGIIVKGRGSDWQVVPNDHLEQDIWSVCPYGDAVYFSTMSGVLRLKDGELELIKTLGPDMRTAMSLFVGPSGLWSVGMSDIVLFDGENWQTIAQSD